MLLGRSRHCSTCYAHACHVSFSSIPRYCMQNITTSGLQPGTVRYKPSRLVKTSFRISDSRIPPGLYITDHNTASTTCNISNDVQCPDTQQLIQFESNSSGYVVDVWLL